MPRPFFETLDVQDRLGECPFEGLIVGLELAEVAVPKRLFRAILERIRRLRLPQAVPR